MKPRAITDSAAVRAKGGCASARAAGASRRAAPIGFGGSLLAVFALACAAPATGVFAADRDPARSIPPAPGIPHFAYVTAIEGLAPDSLGGRDFMTGFNSAFVENTFGTERASVRPGELLASVPISNRFRLLLGANNPGAWQVQLSLRGVGADLTPGGRSKRPRAAARPAARAASPSAAQDTLLDIMIVARSPEAVAAGARAVPSRVRLVFPRPSGSRAEFARAAGRAAALLTLEVLHHQSEDLAPDERLRIDGATRR